MSSYSNEITKIPIEKIVPFPNHPFKVVDDEAMDLLVESVRENGDVLTPITVRMIDNEYQLISGHRRTHASKRAGLDTISALIIECTDEQAVVKMVDSNMQRPKLAYSERAFAYKMKLDAIKHQGKATSRQIVGKKESADKISDNKSGRQIQRFIRLTYLIPELLQMVDERRIAFQCGVELSYLSQAHQKHLYSEMLRTRYDINLRQALKLKKAEKQHMLNDEEITRILTTVPKQDRICFRVSPALKEKLDTQSELGRMSRSELLRTVSTASGNVYVAQDLKEELFRLRADVARLGNLYKLHADQLAVLLENPLLASADRQKVHEMLNDVTSDHAELVALRKEMVDTMQRLNKTVNRLNGKY